MSIGINHLLKHTHGKNIDYLIRSDRIIIIIVEDRLRDPCMIIKNCLVFFLREKFNKKIKKVISNLLDESFLDKDFFDQLI